MEKETMIIWEWVDKENGIVILCPYNLETQEVTVGLAIFTSIDDPKFKIVGEREN